MPSKCSYCGEEYQGSWTGHAETCRWLHPSKEAEGNPELRPIRVDVQREVLAGLAQLSEIATSAYQELHRRYLPQRTLSHMRDIEALAKNLIGKLEAIV